MKKKMYVVELKTRNCLMSETLSTTAKLETVLRKLEEEVRPNFPVAIVKVHAENGVVVTLNWEVEVKRHEQIKTEKELVVSVSYINAKGKYCVREKEFDSAKEIQWYMGFLKKDGARDISYEILYKKEATV